MVRYRTLSPSHLKLCDNTLRSKGLLAPNLAIIAAIVLKNELLTKNLIRYYKTDVTDGTLDTYEREHLLESVSIHYVGLPWPCNGDSLEYTQSFVDRFNEVICQADWVFLNEE